MDKGRWRVHVLLPCLSVQTLAVEYMNRVAQSDSPQAGQIKHAALYNIGQAHMEGYGVPASSVEAER